MMMDGWMDGWMVDGWMDGWMDGVEWSGVEGRIGWMDVEKACRCLEVSTRYLVTVFVLIYFLWL